MQAPEQPVDQLRPLDQIAHEQEQRNRDQNIVRHHAIGPLHEKVKHLPVLERAGDAAIGEQGEEHAHPHERKGRGKAEHDADADQREHEEPQVPVRQVAPGHEHDHREDDQRHQREAEPQLLTQLHLRGSWCTTYASSFWMSSSLTWTISFSLSTSTSWTSSSREGQWPCCRQMTQRMISTMPCTSTNAPATGMMVLNG